MMEREKMIKAKIKTIVNGFTKKKEGSVNIFTESPLKTSFYEELQKNEWCNLINDEPENLIDIVKINIRKTKKV